MQPIYLANNLVISIEIKVQEIHPGQNEWNYTDSGNNRVSWIRT